MTFPVTGSFFRTGEAGPSDPYNRLSSARLYSSALTSCRVLLRRNRFLRAFENRGMMIVHPSLDYPNLIRHLDVSHRAFKHAQLTPDFVSWFDMG